MIADNLSKSLILLASPAGFEPATCGLEIRCCYPAELRGRDGEAFTPRSPSSASAAMAGFDRTARGSAAWGGCRRWPDFSPSSLSARCETGVISHRHEGTHPREKG